MAGVLDRFTAGGVDRDDALIVIRWVSVYVRSSRWPSSAPHPAPVASCPRSILLPWSTTSGGSPPGSRHLSSASATARDGRTVTLPAL